jgi:hypothetical protein
VSRTSTVNRLRSAVRLRSVVGYGREVMRVLSDQQQTVRPVVRIVQGGLVVVALVGIVMASPSGASVHGLAQESVNSSSEVQTIRYQLFAIAGLLAVLLVGFVWHTSPRRRVRLAAQVADEPDKADEAERADEAENEVSDEPVDGALDSDADRADDDRDPGSPVSENG